MLDEAPVFKIKTISAIGDKDFIIVDREAFHNHVIEFIDLRLSDNFASNDPEDLILCYFKPEYPIGIEHELLEATLEPRGYKKSLETCLSHFQESEDYEKCAEISKLLKKI